MQTSEQTNQTKQNILTGHVNQTTTVLTNSSIRQPLIQHANANQADIAMQPNANPLSSQDSVGTEANNLHLQCY